MLWDSKTVCWSVGNWWRHVKLTLTQGPTPSFAFMLELESKQKVAGFQAFNLRSVFFLWGSHEWHKCNSSGQSQEKFCGASMRQAILIISYLFLWSVKDHACSNGSFLNQGKQLLLTRCNGGHPEIPGARTSKKLFENFFNGLKTTKCWSKGGMDIMSSCRTWFCVLSIISTWIVNDFIWFHMISRFHRSRVKINPHHASSETFDANCFQFAGVLRQS